MKINHAAIVYLMLQAQEATSQRTALERTNDYIQNYPPKHGVKGISGMRSLTSIVTVLREANLIDEAGRYPTQEGIQFLETLNNLYSTWYDGLVHMEYEKGKIQNITRTIVV